ncbi:MAG: IS4 family transposase [Anaerolineales bacterium]|nr:IS4 family transposase [Anaerolineales bacterium]
MNKDKTIRQKSEELAQDIEEFLQDMIGDSEIDLDTPRNPSGRKAILPALVLWSGIIVAVLRGFSSQLQIWRLVSWEGFWNYPRYPITDQAVYNRLAEESGPEVMQALFYRVRDGLKERLAPYAQQKLAAFAAGVYAIDGSTLDKVARHLPKLRQVANGDSKLLPGKVVGVFDIRYQQWHEMFHLTNPNQNDKFLATQLLESIPTGSLVLTDLGFFSFPWFDTLTDNGYWWISRLRNQVTYEVIHTFFQQGDLFDGLVWLGKYRADRAAHAVRLVTFSIGKVHFRYITNVRDPLQLTMKDIAILYARRWDIEMAFKMVKRHLKLHILWSAKPQIVLLQLWAVLIIAQILHALQMEIAGQAKVDPFDVSLDLVTQYVPRLTQEGKNPVQMIVENGHRFGFIRPSRRIRIQVPEYDSSQLMPLPDGIVLTRKPRYAQRKCGPRGPAP